MSFITWYMNKNRPLPLGELFDPYREADFQRRKAEGFPKPLYPSDIPTPRDYLRSTNREGENRKMVTFLILYLKSFLPNNKPKERELESSQQYKINLKIFLYLRKNIYFCRLYYNSYLL